jgi:hypothetical protein
VLRLCQQLGGRDRECESYSVAKRGGSRPQRQAKDRDVGSQQYVERRVGPRFGRSHLRGD